MSFFTDKIQWLNNECVSAHYLKPQSNSNSNVFSNICYSCLWNKFGITEDYISNKNFPLECSFMTKNSKNLDTIEDYKEGPFLKAKGSNHSKIIFDENTIILPCGYIILDTIYSNILTLYFSEIVPKVFFLREFFFNPYLFNYFKNLIEEKEIFHTSNKAEINFEKDSTIKLLALHLQNINVFLDGVFDLDGCTLSTLIEPYGNESLMYKFGKNFDLDENKTIRYEILDLFSTESRQFERNSTQTISAESFVLSYYSLTERCAVKNTATSKYIISNDDFIRLQNLYCKTATFLDQMKENIRQNINSLHVQNENNDSMSFTNIKMFCVPSDLEFNGDIIRQYKPNVELIKHVGLVSTDKIFEGDYFVINNKVNQKKYYSNKINKIKKINPDKNISPLIKKFSKLY